MQKDNEWLSTLCGSKTSHSQISLCLFYVGIYFELSRETMGFRGGRSRILHCLGKPRTFFKDIPALGLHRNFLILRLIMLPVKYAFVKSKRESKKKVVIIVNLNSLQSPHFFVSGTPLPLKSMIIFPAPSLQLRLFYFQFIQVQLS